MHHRAPCPSHPLWSLLSALTVAAVVAGCSAPLTLTRPAVGEAPRPLPLDSYVEPDAGLVILVDAAKLREMAMFESLVHRIAEAGTVAGTPLAKFTERCGEEGWLAVDRLLLTGSDEDHLLLVADGPRPETLLTCLGRLADEPEPLTMEGRSGLTLGGSEIALVDGARLFAGARDRVVAALAAGIAEDDPSHVLHRMAGTSSSAFRAYVLAPPDEPLRSIGLALDGDDYHARLELALQAPSPEQADFLTDQLDGARRVGLTVAPQHASGEELRALSEALSSVTIARHVEHQVGVELLVEGGARHQAETLMAFAGFSFGLVRGMRNEAITQHAQARLGELAERVAAYAEAHRKGPYGLPVLPPSAPSTPAEVPSGTPIPVSAASWSHPTWAELAFAPEEESYFSYELRTSRDGRLTTIRATGDVDGDGEPTVLELEVRVGFDGKLRVQPKGPAAQSRR